MTELSIHKVGADRLCPIALEMSGVFVALRMSGFRGQALGGVADEGLTPERTARMASGWLKG